MRPLSSPSSLKRHAVDIFLAGVAAVEPGRAVKEHLSLDGDTLHAGEDAVGIVPGGRICVVGAGKAGAPMAAAVKEILSGRLEGGVVSVKYGHLAPVAGVTIREAAHPVPDEAGMSAAREVIHLLHRMGKDDLVICLLSGGGSALLPCPAPPLTLTDKQDVTNLLLACGAEIGEINCVRKHLSLLKGGGLARLAHPARVVTLILSDVVGDPLDVIASGPTVGDPTTYAEALAILRRYGLRGKTPEAVVRHLEEGAGGMQPETRKPGYAELQGGLNVLVGTNAMAVDAAAVRARDLGYNTMVLSTTVTGDTTEAARAHAELAARIARDGRPVARPACVLSGGETTVVIKGSGKGGRNQEFALAAAPGIDALPDTVILSGGTDGTDGPTDAAGALADGTTVRRARDAGMDPGAFLQDNDAYHFFQALGDLLVTGPTLTNVMDLRVVLVGGP
ncbi:MAG: glycerate kinase [bacterium]|nr:MAG: glycerate kinase [bacterium]